MNGHTDAVAAGFLPGAEDCGEPHDAMWVCPYCGRTKPSGYEESNWACCGKAGHAVLVDAQTYEVIDNGNF